MCQKQNANADKLFPVDLENLTRRTCCKNILISMCKKMCECFVLSVLRCEKTTRKFLLY